MVPPVLPKSFDCHDACLCKQPQWVKHYALDWVVSLAVLLLGGMIYLFVEPNNMDIPYGNQNANYSFPSGSNMFPSWTLSFVLGLCPFSIIGFIFFITRNKHDLHNILLALLQGFGYALFWTTWIVKFVGRPRPNFFEGENSSVVASDASWNSYQSYPSGHASQGMVFLVTVSLYIAGKLQWLAPGGGEAWKQVLVHLPTLFAALVATSRVRDYQHGFADVNLGMAIGFFLAFASYFSLFPSLFSPTCHLPRPRGQSHVHRREPVATSTPKETEMTADM